jgi:phosphotransferase system  glucose/maltose/N-acetylglucosamine-specific IIC component
MFISRLVAASAAVVASAAAVVVGVPGTVQAHGGPAAVTVSAQPGDGAAAVTAVVAYADGHPVRSVTLQADATAAGRIVPVTMTQTSAGQYTGAAALTPGTWQITVRVSGEASGTGRTTVTLAGQPSPSAGPGTRGGRGDSSVPAWIWTVLAFAGAAVAVVGTRRRARRNAAR